MIGAAGGTFTSALGVSVTIPAGALTAATTITIEQTGTAPSGVPLYTFGPAGTTFSSPVTVRLPVPAGVTAPALYWSRSDNAALYEIVPATLVDGKLEASVSHFSTAFVATGGPLYAPANTARLYTVTAPNSAPFTEANEPASESAQGRTRKITPSNAGTYQVQTFSLTDGGAVTQTALVTYRATDGVELARTTYSPPLLIIPADPKPGTVASSTSTVTNGTTTATQTRTLTVGGLESVTVPAGTYSALKITTYITQSNAGPNYVINWFVPGIGSVKSVGYAESTPAATTTRGLTSHFLMECSAETCACNLLENTGALVQTQLVATAPPVAAGGSILDGTYHLTARRIYTGPGGGSGLFDAKWRSTITLQSGHMRMVLWDSQVYPNGAESRVTARISTAGNQLTATPICVSNPEQFGATSAYTALANELQLISINNCGTDPYCDPGADMVFTRQ